MLDTNRPTLAECERRGWKVDRAEMWNSYSRRYNDLFGFVDYVALTGSEIVAIQATSYGNIAARLHKMAELPSVKSWLTGGGEIVVWGWSKMANGRLELTEVDLTLSSRDWELYEWW